MVHKQSRIFMLLLVLLMIFIMQSAQVAAQSADNSLMYEGDDYYIELNFGPYAGIQEDAYLKVTEINEGSKEYSQYFSKTEEFVSEEKDAKVSFARFFDVTIMAGEKEIEPDDTVHVSIIYKEGIEKAEEEQISVVHFVEDGSEELLEVREECEKDEVTKISFEQDSFSVIGMILFDGVDTNIKGPESEIITGTDVIHVTKEWSDGEEAHKKDSVTITLYEQGETKEEITLCDDNKWSGDFKNLDRKKRYSIKETKAESGNMDILATYKTTITNSSEKQWCPVEENLLENGKKVILVFDDGEKKLLRKSGDYNEMNLRSTKVNITNDEFHGNYFKTDVKNNYIWNVYWNESSHAWNLYSVEGNAYLSLLVDEESGAIYWATSRELVEGSNLRYEDGMFFAAVEGATKYLGNITAEGPYEGIEKNDENVTKFQIYTYQSFPPVICHILNEKNETTKEHEMNVDVVTKKTIDYLGDGGDNPDTDADNGKLAQNILKDLYRLNLSVKMQTDVTGLDLLMVIDVSSSMKDYRDAKDENGNLIQRSEALRQALNEFVPQFLSKGTKNRLAVVAFESESMILQEWTNAPQDLLGQINYESNGEMPLYNGEGTNYEAALARAHEVLAMRGYSNNARAMLFLSDGDPTMYLEGNDETEAGNVTCHLGEASLSEKGIVGSLLGDMRAVWGMTDGKAPVAANEAIASFQNHNPEIMIGTIAFNTKVTDSLRNLATDSNFVVKIEQGSPADLIEAMRLITEYAPANIVVEDELSENIEIYSDYPDYKIIKTDEEDKQTLLYSANEGLTEEGKLILDNTCPLVVSGKKVIMSFHDQYTVKNNDTYHLSFHVNASQKAFDKYADSKGEYSELGDQDTDYKGNDTSSLKEGFYSNGDETKVRYSLHGVEIHKNYKRPVIQADKASFCLKKTDMNENIITSGAEFSLYRAAEDGDKDRISLDGVSGEFVLAAKGKTDENGSLFFENLRRAVFDTGYPYYLVEEKAPQDYEKLNEPVKIFVYTDHVEVEEENRFVATNENGELVVRNTGTYVQGNDKEIVIPVTGGNGIFSYYLIGVLLIAGGLYMKNRKKFSKIFMMVMAVIVAVQTISLTAFAIDTKDTGMIQLNGVEKNAKVNVYRLMDINYDYQTDQPKNPMYMWTDKVAGWMKDNYPEYIDVTNKNAVEEKFADAKDGEVAGIYDKLAVAIKLGKVNPDCRTVEICEESVTIDHLEMGNYFLLIEDGLKVYKPLTANVVPEWKENAWQMKHPVVEAKATWPAITKTIDKGLKKDNVQIGDLVSYELVAGVPEYPENSLGKTFIIGDTLSEGLSFEKDSLKVYGLNTGEESVLLETGYTRTEGEETFKLEFNYDTISLYESVKVVYSAVLNENASVGESGNLNKAYLKYNNNPYNALDFITQESDAKVYTYGIKIMKIDEDTSKGLAGAEFTLKKEGTEIKFMEKDGQYYAQAADTDDDSVVKSSLDGTIILNGLDEGVYTLTEVKAPDGYVKLQNPVEITVSDKDMDGKLEIDGEKMADGYVPVTVKNDKGFTLPVTGGVGTTLFNVIGIALIGCGLLIMVICSGRGRRRK